MSEKAKNYRSTLNLPNTALPIYVVLPELEKKVLQKWGHLDLYQKIREQAYGKKKFLLHDGPPYANGPIHLGHAVNKILKDFILKAKRFSGFDASYTPGWDCHGLPIEFQVGQELGHAGNVSGRSFRERCRQYADSQVAHQKKSFVRLGVLGDWDAPYKTMDFLTQSRTVRLLADLYRKGYVQRGRLPVYWCLNCQSALSVSEVEYQEIDSEAIYVCFPLLDLKELEARLQCTIPCPAFALIWTTTAWTLPANYAVAVHPALRYLLVQPLGLSECFLVAKDQAKEVMALNQFAEYTVLMECPGEALVGAQTCHPLLARPAPIIASTHVSAASGTGLVHVAPAHGPEDFELSSQWNLPVETPVGVDGYFCAKDPLVPGMRLEQASLAIIELLEGTATLYHRAPYTHSYPHCWRHKTPLIYRVTPQWFVSFKRGELRQRLLTAVDKVQWLPTWGERRLANMLEMRPDWCISRQRVWGVPIPIFLHKKTGEPHPQTAQFMDKVSDLIEEIGVEAWWALKPKSLLEGNELALYQKETAVLDVWFDSGATHYSVVALDSGGEEGISDLYLEGSDQYRGWFMSSLISSVARTGSPPYRQVLTHGFVVDHQGHKMSKSMGNVIGPQEVIEKSGADILRLWVASTEYRAEISISEEILKHVSEAYRRIRNTIRFLLANLFDFDASSDTVSFDHLVALDQWALVSAKRLQETLIDAYDQYDFQRIYHALMQFSSIDLGSFYLDVIKDRLYTLKRNSHARRSAQTVLYQLAQALIRWIAPILSFTAEELWEQATQALKESSVFLTSWWQFPSLDLEKMKFSMQDWGELIKLRQKVMIALEQQKAEVGIRANLEARLEIVLPASWVEKLASNQAELPFLFSVSRVETFHSEEMDQETDQELGDSVEIRVHRVTGVKCPRCWLYYKQNLFEGSEDLETCRRCQINLSEDEEEKRALV